MKVWVVFSWHGNENEQDHMEVEGVFTKQDKADGIAKIINQAITVCPCDLDEHFKSIDENHSWPDSYHIYPKIVT